MLNSSSWFFYFLHNSLIFPYDSWFISPWIPQSSLHDCFYSWPICWFWFMYCSSWPDWFQIRWSAFWHFLSLKLILYSWLTLCNFPLTHFFLMNHFFRIDTSLPHNFILFPWFLSPSWHFFLIIHSICLALVTLQFPFSWLNLFHDYFFTHDCLLSHNFLYVCLYSLI